MQAPKLGGVCINVHAVSDGGDKLENLLVLKEPVEVHRYVDTGRNKANVVVTVLHLEHL